MDRNKRCRDVLISLDVGEGTGLCDVIAGSNIRAAPAIEPVACRRRGGQGDVSVVVIGCGAWLRIGLIAAERAAVGDIAVAAADRDVDIKRLNVEGGGDGLRRGDGGEGTGLCDVIAVSNIRAAPAGEDGADTLRGGQGDGGAFVIGLGAACRIRLVAGKVAFCAIGDVARARASDRNDDIVGVNHPLRIQGVGPVHWEVVVRPIRVSGASPARLGVPAVKDVASQAEILRIQCGEGGFCLVRHSSGCRLIILVKGDGGLPLGEEGGVTLLNEVKVADVCVGCPADTISLGVPAGKCEASSRDTKRSIRGEWDVVLVFCLRRGGNSAGPFIDIKRHGE